MPEPSPCSDGEEALSKAGSFEVDSAASVFPVPVLESLVLTGHSSFWSASSGEVSDSSEPRASPCPSSVAEAAVSEISTPLSLIHI